MARKLTTDQVAELCSRYVAGTTGPALARDYGVTATAIYGLLKRRGVELRPSRSVPSGLRPVRSCETCGHTFTVKPAVAKIGWGRFCSKDCKYAPVDAFARIERHVDRSGDCHIWLGVVSGDGGYGKLTIDKKSYSVPRLVLEKKLGRPIRPGCMACHTCSANYPVDDVSYRRCINPNHLYEGTPADNSRDRVEQGRARGRPRRERTAA